ncbi:MAG: helix-turn-helix domain-containing protein [Dehalococcoidia bacterium]|nr:helix-turn-helix domain-containing protein [Dehalococcoidia bacterium]MDP6228664.1 helix-turn-helix domain-containing protein [Dehalococcoidia bacterium]MDP7200312.1 helix-turn-helix domain-containing protein [Dehalococcoidia bacterium]HJN87897.1 helix-turn-helix domain-containing protein [Dehalococcoidia bacterium]
MASSHAINNGNGFQPTESNGALLTVTQVADFLHAHPHSVRRWADSGLLHCYRIGFRADRRFKPEDIEKFLFANANGRSAA